MKKIGVGILSYNRWESLHRLLMSILKYTKLSEIDIFISDDGSSQETKTYLDKIKFATVIQNANNIGVAGNTNILLNKLKEYEYILLLNDDVEVLKTGWHFFYAKAIKKTGIHHFTYVFPKKNIKQDISMNGHIILELNRPSGAIMALDNTCLRRVGYFDIRFGKYGYEHIDWSNRVSLSGIQPHGYFDLKKSYDFFNIHQKLSYEQKTKIRKINLKEAKKYYNICKKNKNRIYITDSKTRKITDKKINLYLYRPNKFDYNFGEFLNIKIFEKLGFCINSISKYNIPTDNDLIVFSIGGILNSIHYNRIKNIANKIYVWGSGAGSRERDVNKKININNDQFKILMVRGPMTKKHLDVKDCVIGDPGFVSRRLFNFKKDNTGVVFVKFYVDKYENDFKGAKMIDTYLRKGSLETSFDNIMYNICNAEFVLSSAMHGAIVAHSYNKPWAIAKKKHRDIETEWKWHDVWSGMGLDSTDIKTCTTVDEGMEWWDSVKNKIRRVDDKYIDTMLDLCNGI